MVTALEAIRLLTQEKLAADGRLVSAAGAIDALERIDRPDRACPASLPPDLRSPTDDAKPPTNRPARQPAPDLAAPTDDPKPDRRKAKGKGKKGTRVVSINVVVDDDDEDDNDDGTIDLALEDDDDDGTIDLALEGDEGDIDLALEDEVEAPRFTPEQVEAYLIIAREVNQANVTRDGPFNWCILREQVLLLGDDDKVGPTFRALLEREDVQYAGTVLRKGALVGAGSLTFTGVPEHLQALVREQIHAFSKKDVKFA